MTSLSQPQRVVRLYRSLIKLSRDWVVDIEYWRQNALEIRHRFDVRGPPPPHTHTHFLVAILHLEWNWGESSLLNLQWRP